MVWFNQNRNIRKQKVDLKQQLTSECEKLRRRKEIEERKRINYQFKVNPKKLYRKFKGESNINITTHLGKTRLRNSGQTSGVSQGYLIMMLNG